MRIQEHVLRFAAASGSTGIALAVVAAVVSLVAWFSGAAEVAVDSFKVAGLGVAAAILARRVDALVERARASGTR